MYIQFNKYYMDFFFPIKVKRPEAGKGDDANLTFRARTWDLTDVSILTLHLANGYAEKPTMPYESPILINIRDYKFSHLCYISKR